MADHVVCFLDYYTKLSPNGTQASEETYRTETGTGEITVGLFISDAKVENDKADLPIAMVFPSLDIPDKFDPVSVWVLGER